MKRYIRTKDGKIIKIIYNCKIIKCKNKIIVKDYYGETHYHNAKISKNIEDLITIGDLIEFRNGHSYKVEGKLTNYDKQCISKLYTKQGNNYILVARKENGEWRVL